MTQAATTSVDGAAKSALPGAWGGARRLNFLQYLWVILSRHGSLFHVADAVIKRYGPVVFVRLGQQTVWIDTRPATLHEVLVKRAELFRKNDATRELAQLLGDGLVTAEGDKWRHHRSMINRLFFRQSMRQITQVTKEQLPAALAPLEEQLRLRGPGAHQSVQLRGFVHEMMVSISAMSLFGVAPSEVRSMICTLVDSFMTLSARGFVVGRLLRALGQRRFARQLAEVDGYMTGLIARRRQAGCGGSAFLDALLKLQEEQRQRGDAEALGEPAFTDRDVRDEAFTMLAASHDTVATTLSWALYLLASRPQMQERIVREEAGTAGAAPFVTWVFQETLRLYPPVWMIGRSAKEDVELPHMRLAKDDMILIPVHHIHRDGGHWRDPLCFDPERFAQRAGEPHGAHYLPFGLGARACIGQGVAQWQGRVILEQILKRFVLSLPQPADAQPHYSLIMHASPRLKVQLSLRDPGGFQAASQR